MLRILICICLCNSTTACLYWKHVKDKVMRSLKLTLIDFAKCVANSLKKSKQILSGRLLCAPGVSL
ncbi:CLUMA_CG003355, isoform A [Clunio marinus]|uniref:CLUMA_CG003355, isoform A n=1 Tax=Clunio marinus TaxID=568069 RepID=A0A1J1HPU3_9DIPT|nr:CLUMA_CG003355, isoform A [Clunio marinus]